MRIIKIFMVFQLLMLGSNFVHSQTYWNGSVFSIEISGGDKSNFLHKAKYSLFIPKNAVKIRGIIIHQHGCLMEGSGQPMVTDAQYQAFANKWNLAVLGPDFYPKEERNCYDWINPDDGSFNSLMIGLDSLSVLSGHNELNNVPWILWGHSGGGYWVLSMIRKMPSRVIAAFAYSPAFDPDFDYPDEALKVPVMIRHAGANDANHQGINCWQTALHTFEKLRSKGGLVSIAFNQNQNHNYSYVRQMALPFFESVLKQRLSSDTSNELKDMDINKSWLADTNTFTDVSIYNNNEFTGNKLSKSWLPDSICAEKFKEFILTGAVSDKTPPPSPKNITFDDKNMKIQWEANADIESGIKYFKIFKNDNFFAYYPESQYFQSFDTNGDIPVPVKQPLMEFSFNESFRSNLNSISISVVNSSGLESEKSKLAISSELPEIKKVFYIATDGNDNNPGTYELPFKTISKAKSEIRKINKEIQGDIAVYLLDGRYYQDSTLLFDYEDSGFNGNRIFYESFDCQTPQISGGIKISDWQIHDAANNIFKAQIDKTLDTRQLYVNGRRAVRARSKNAEGWIESTDGYISPVNISNWKNIQDIEIVSRNEWKNHRGLIESINGKSIKMSQPYWDNVHQQFDAPPVWIENAYELIDEEDEWFLDKSDGYIYYKPRNDENISKSEIIIPKLELLLKCSGLQNVTFRGLSFLHATWLTPNTKEGYPMVQADVRFSDNTWVQNPGNIILEYCRIVIFDNNRFEHLGVTAVQLYFGCKYNKIINNVFKDISGSGISIGSILTFSPSENDMVDDNLIENNLIRDIGAEYEGCVGIFAPVSEKTVIKRNTLINLPYSAISLGWGWSNQLVAGKNSEISFNRIDSIMTKLKDGGGIYTLSSLPGTRIFNNYISNVQNGFGALYPDLGSSNMRWHHNVIRNVKCWLSLWSDQCLNDTIDFNYVDNQISVINGTNCIVENNHYVQNDNWNIESSDIMKNSGLQTDSSRRHPIIMSQPTDTLIEKGRNLLLEIKISDYYAYSLFFKWYRNEILIHESKEPFFKITNIDESFNGNYKCEINSGCGTIFSKVFSLKIDENINSIAESSKSLFSVKPNPASEFITISLKSWSPPSRWTPTKIEIYDVMGVLMQSIPVNLTPALSKGECVRIDISNLSPGVYFVRMGDKVEKFVKM